MFVRNWWRKDDWQVDSFYEDGLPTLRKGVQPYSDGGIVVSIAAFQAADLGSIPSHCNSILHLHFVSNFSHTKDNLI